MTNDILGKLRIPAIGMLVMGILNGVFGAVVLLSGILRFTKVSERQQIPTEQAEKIGYLIATFGGYGIGLLAMIVTPIIIFGAIRMMKGQNRGLAIFSAILSTLPLTACCFFISGIFGVWSLIVLVQSDVKSFFKNGGEQANFYPPQPPQNW